MRKLVFQALTTQLPSSRKVTAPELTGYTLTYRARPAFDSVKYLKHRDRLTGYIKVRNLLAFGVNAEELFGPCATTTKGDIKLASLSEQQLIILLRLIVKLSE